jgi:outer membrane protein assembly factor BamD
LIRKLNVLFIVASVFILLNCSGSVDTSKFNSEEYFNYVKGLYDEEDYEACVREFQNFLLQFSGSAFNDDAQYYLGMTYYQRKQYLLAAYEFSKLIRNIPASLFVPDAQYMLADSYYQLAPPYQLDQAYTKKAIEEFQAFIDFFPSNNKVEDAEKHIKTLNDRLAEKEYQSAVIYEKMEYDRAAIKYYTQVADTYHDTRYAPLSLYRKIKIELRKGMSSEALSDISVFLSRYPDNSDAQELQQIEARAAQIK